jgi:hypothetical protein
MSAYKKLNKQDAYITTYTAHKSWTVSGSGFSAYGIQVIPTLDNNYLRSLQQLYYPSKISGSIVSHSFDYYDQTTLNNPNTRNLITGSFVLSIPRELTGTNLKPGVGIDFTINNVQQIRYVSASYVSELYFDDPTITSGVNTLRISDDGEGGLYVSGSSPKQYVGDIIYPHGMIIITDSSYATVLQNAWNSYLYGGRGATIDNLVVSWQSSQPIFTHNYHCKLRESEYNFTYNPSALSSSLKSTYDNNSDIYNISASVSNGYLNDNVTGSAFQPYITSVGLYNDANELIAVGKMSRPVPKSANTDMTIIVKIDI